MSNKAQCNRMVSANHTINVGPESESTSTYCVFEGHFETPMTAYLGDIIPEEARTAKFQLVLPKKWPNPRIKPVVIHMAGTGDHVSLATRLSLTSYNRCLISILVADGC